MLSLLSRANGRDRSANLLCQVGDLRIFGLGLSLLANKLGAEVILIAQEAFARLLQEVLLLLQLAQLHRQLCLHTPVSGHCVVTPNSPAW